MRRNLEFVLRLLDTNSPADVSAEDFDGPHGGLLRILQAMGVIASEPGMNPVPSCPYCFRGSPYLLGGRYVCDDCGSRVGKQYLQLWRCDLPAFLRWYAGQQGLSGGIEQIDDGLWRLGTIVSGDRASECFYLRGVHVTDLSRRRLAAFRSVLVLHGKPEPPRLDSGGARSLSLAEVITADDNGLAVQPLRSLLNGASGRVSFDPRTGVLRVGDAVAGQVPTGTRECAFLERLELSIGEAVPYADLKRSVRRATGSRDERDEATYCQRLKSRLKHQYGITAIDWLIETDRAVQGYRLVSEARIPGA